MPETFEPKDDGHAGIESPFDAAPTGKSLADAPLVIPRLAAADGRANKY
jgi:hypothetical protein